MQVKLEEVCKRIYAGGDVPKDRYSEVKTDQYQVPIYANAEKDEGLYGYTDVARENDLSITVAARGTIGYTAIRKEPFLPVVRLITVVPDTDKISVRYLYYALRNCKPQSSGTSIPQLTVPDIKKNYVYLYEIEEQERIADILDKAQDIINVRKRELEQLDNLIKARFVELFGDRFINDKNWCTRKLGECMNFNNGKAHEQVVDENGEYTLITSRAIASDLKDVRRTNELLFPLYQNDIVMVMSDVPNGRALAKCLLIDADESYTLNQRICSFDNYEFNPVFLVNLLNRHQYFLGFNDGNGQTNLRKNDILECDLIIPPMELQEQFAVFVKQVDKSKVAVQKALDEAQLLFDSLMQKYFG